MEEERQIEKRGQKQMPDSDGGKMDILKENEIENRKG